MLEKAHRGHCEVMPVAGFMSGCTFSASPDTGPPPDSATMPKLIMPTARMQLMTSITTPYGTALSARRKSCLFRAVEFLTKELAACPTPLRRPNTGRPSTSPERGSPRPRRRRKPSASPPRCPRPKHEPLIRHQTGHP